MNEKERIYRLMHATPIKLESLILSNQVTSELLLTNHDGKSELSHFLKGKSVLSHLLDSPKRLTIIRKLARFGLITPEMLSVKIGKGDSSLLQIASEDTRALEALLKLGITENMLLDTNKAGNTVFHFAVNNIFMFDKLLALDVFKPEMLLSRNIKGKTPLYYIMHTPYANHIINKLIKLKMLTRDMLLDEYQEGITILHKLAASGKVMRKILDLNIVKQEDFLQGSGPQNSTPFSAALSHNNNDTEKLEIIKAFVKSGMLKKFMLTNEHSEQKYQGLFLIAKNEQQFSALLQSDEVSLEMLSIKGDNYGTPLDTALKFSASERVIDLLKNSALFKTEAKDEIQQIINVLTFNELNIDSLFVKNTNGESNLDVSLRYLTAETILDIIFNSSLSSELSVEYIMKSDHKKLISTLIDHPPKEDLALKIFDRPSYYFKLLVMLKLSFLFDVIVDKISRFFNKDQIHESIDTGFYNEKQEVLSSNIHTSGSTNGVAPAKNEASELQQSVKKKLHMKMNTLMR